MIFIINNILKFNISVFKNTSIIITFHILANAIISPVNSIETIFGILINVLIWQIWKIENLQIDH